MRLALAQLSSSEDRLHNLAKVTRAMEQAARQGAEAIVFPEVVLDRFFPQNPADPKARKLAETIPGPSCDAVAAKARELSLVTVFNLYEVDEQGRTFDSSPVFDADGTHLGTTRMVHITDYEGFHEKDYYHPGDLGAPVYDTQVGRIGVAICYDRHYPEYMRALAVAGAELVVIPQAGTVGEWPEGLYEAEVRTSAFQNGYFAALCNRVGEEEKLSFSGESFACDPNGQFLVRGKSLEEDLVMVDMDLSLCQSSHARRLFFRDRRPELYGAWLGPHKDPR
ncbi:MAG: carbon-nitrogen hydrolase family protein [Deltaproteobacteria bacterium]|nr:carbon-nitrogen hydrolase family protein [Deltaproteobacteria bacterium]